MKCGFGVWEDVRGREMAGKNEIIAFLNIERVWMFEHWINVSQCICVLYIVDMSMLKAFGIKTSCMLCT